MGPSTSINVHQKNGVVSLMVHQITSGPSVTFVGEQMASCLMSCAPCFYAQDTNHIQVHNRLVNCVVFVCDRLKGLCASSSFLSTMISVCLQGYFGVVCQVGPLIRVPGCHTKSWEIWAGKSLQCGLLDRFWSETTVKPRCFLMGIKNGSGARGVLSAE